jgi:catechol 2,3-dioxygenase-like lactoylglutathione lyase family enzyme
MLSIGSVVINVADVRRAAAFWCSALGYEPLREIEDDWVILVPSNGVGQRISINLSDQAPPDVPHVHLDLYAGDAADQAAEVERLIGLGAERVDWPLYPEDEEYDYIVLADPDGNRFCVIDTVGPG